MPVTLAPAVRSTARRPSAATISSTDKPKAEPKILFQTYFKSVGPRTYAAQVKEAGNGNHFLVLTEGKRDEANGDVKKTKLFVFSEDFVEFFRLVKQTAEFIKANPVSPKVKQRREKFWAKQQSARAGEASPKSG
jgi:hypothetical protein